MTHQPQLRGRHHVIKKQKRVSIKRFLKRNLAHVGLAQCINALADKVYTQTRSAILAVMATLFNNHPYVPSLPTWIHVDTESGFIILSSGLVHLPNDYLLTSCYTYMYIYRCLITACLVYVMNACMCCGNSVLIWTSTITCHDITTTYPSLPSLSLIMKKLMRKEYNH